MPQYFWVTLIILLVSCGSDVNKKGFKNKNANNANNANNVNNAQCGDGVLDSTELCDPAIESGEGACPVTCPEAEACGAFTLQGSVSDCTAECVLGPVACLDGDECCPAGCDQLTDNDCTNECGNGVVEDPEVCDGDCPTSCDDGDACTVDGFSGSADTCNVVCENSPRTQCADNDTCCPAGCSPNNDNDCTCTPTTSCQELSKTCGMIDDGCSMVSCGTCGPSETCMNDQCQATFSIGDACTSDSQCFETCITEADAGWPGGYCSKGCTSNSDCGPLANCDFQDDQGNGVCVLSCATDSDCDRGYLCDDRTLNGVKECVPGSSGSQAIGTGCLSLDQCTGRSRARCFSDPTEFANGYCTMTCKTDANCPNGSHCNGQYCLDDCTATGQCATGLSCYDSDNDGKQECWQFAPGSGAIGAPCTSITQCGGGTWGRCANNTTQGFPGGYCYRLCGPGQTTCGADALCAPLNDGGGFCLDGCNSNNDCRTNYRCLDNDGDPSTTDVCLPPAP